MKIVAISDTHGALPENLPGGDLLTISGDVCEIHGSHHPTHQRHFIDRKFLPYLNEMIKNKKYKDIVWIFGNHDFIGENLLPGDLEDNFRKNLPAHVHYLRDSSVTIDGKVIYGTPWVKNLPRWAFNATEDVLFNKFAKIPEGVDVLLSHSPVDGFNDTILKPIYEGQELLGHLGSKSLYEHVKRAKPRYIFVAHIHSGNHNMEKIIYNWDEPGNYTETYNVSLLDENYNINYQPLIIEI